MTERKDYEMTHEDMDTLLKAGEAVPYMIIGGFAPMTQQERANHAWIALGKRMGFDGMSVRPIPGKDFRFFTAEPLIASARSSTGLE